MATDTHIKFAGLEGEATHKDHKGEIEVLSWNWHVTNVSSAASGGGSGLGKGTAGDFTLTKMYDKASPNLAKFCASGKHIDAVKVTARKSGEGQKDFLIISFKEVMIVQVSSSGHQAGDIVESVSFSYKDIEFGYKPQDDKGGMGGEVKFGWDVAKTAIR